MEKFINNRKFSWTSKKQQKWNTEVQRSASGKVRTLTTQLLPEWTITASYPGMTDAEAAELLGFCALRKGSYEPFLWLDPEDNREEGTRLGTLPNGAYQAVMRHGEYAEPVEHIEDVTVYIDGEQTDPANYTVTAGTIVFKAPPDASAIVTADYTYWWKVQFADDGVEIERVYRNVNKATLKMVVVR